MPAGAETATAVDSSVSVPLLVQTHVDHEVVRGWSRGRALVLTAHSTAETYSVLTQLPHDLRVPPDDAARMISRRFGPTVVINPATIRDLPAVLAARGVAGSAVYDALVALAAVENHTTLATRDARARGTYEAIGAEVELVR